MWWSWIEAGDGWKRRAVASDGGSGGGVWWSWIEEGDNWKRRAVASDGGSGGGARHLHLNKTGLATGLRRVLNSNPPLTVAGLA